MQGEVKDKTKSIFFGGSVGMIVAYIMCRVIVLLTPVIGEFFGWAIPITVAIVILLLLKTFAPHLFNNVGFVYLIVATTDATAFCKEIGFLLAGFLIGGSIYLGGILLIIRWIKANARKK